MTRSSWEPSASPRRCVSLQKRVAASVRATGRHGRQLEDMAHPSCAPNGLMAQHNSLSFCSEANWARAAWRIGRGGRRRERGLMGMVASTPLTSDVWLPSPPEGSPAASSRYCSLLFSGRTRSSHVAPELLRRSLTSDGARAGGPAGRTQPRRRANKPGSRNSARRSRSISRCLVARFRQLQKSLAGRRAPAAVHSGRLRGHCLPARFLRIAIAGRGVDPPHVANVGS